MRDAILIGLLYAAVGTLMGVLTYRHAGPLFLDVVEWGSVALIFGCLASLWLSYSHQTTGRPFLLPAVCINLGLCLITVGYILHISKCLSGNMLNPLNRL